MSQTMDTTEQSLSDRIMLTEADLALLYAHEDDEVVQFDEFTPTANFS